MTPKEVVRICGHCGNKTPQEIIGTYEGEDYPLEEDGDYPPIPISYFFCICRTCSQPIIYYEYFSELESVDVSRADCIYPRQKEYSQDYIPKIVRDTYREASRIRDLSPNGYALLARKMIELICKDNTAKGKTLFEKIKSLSEVGIIPKILFDMFENIRFLGNVSAHEDSVTVDHQEARILGEFIDAIQDKGIRRSNRGEV